MNRPYLKNKYVIALTGGIATGKSFVASVLGELGASVVDTDIIARQIVLPGSPILDKIREIWGANAFYNDGSLNRKALADIIFSSAADREKLNDIMHPEIVRRMIEQVNAKPGQVVVIVVPLLFETKIEICYDEVWVVYCHLSQQKERLQARDGITDAEVVKKIASQIPVDFKVKNADVIIDNSFDTQTVRQKILEEWNSLLSRL